MSIIKKGSQIAVRPDTIVEARYQLTASQNDLLDIFLSEISDRDDSKLNYTLEVQKYIHIFKKGSTNIYRDLKAAVDSFKDKGFYLYEDENKGAYYHWFSRISWDDNNGKIDLEIGQSFKKILIEMKRRIYYKPQFPVNLSSAYSKRLYYMLKQYEDTGCRYDKVEVLQEKLMCPKSYMKYSIFKRRILEHGKEEINEKTDIIIDYVEVFNKNKVVQINFSIRKKEIIYIEAPEELNTILMFTSDEYQEIKDKAIICLEEKVEVNKEIIENYIDFCIENINPEKIKKNKKAYIKKVLEAEDNIEAFLKNREEKSIKEENKKAALTALKEAEEKLAKEAEKNKIIQMKKYDVKNEEELHKKLNEKFTIAKY